jgi:hypothetical protein
VGVSSPAHVEKTSAAKTSYVPRRANILQGILRAHFEGFAAIYARQYARRYGRFRLERITEAVKEFVRCGDYRFGVARLKCSNPSCGCEIFRPFSCKTFYLCPSCSQKRTLLFAEFLVENLLLRLPHRVLTFTVPKLLRPYFRHNRTLFAELMQLIHRMVADFQSAAAGRPICGAAVLAYQSSGEFLRFHPHVHGIVLEGGFDEQGRFFHIPFANLQHMAEVFRRRVIALFLERKLIDHSRAASMLSWHHSGFSLDGSIGLYAGDQKAMERLAQYMARPPIALSKVVLEERSGKVLFHAKYNPYFKENLKLFAVTDFIAELTQHIPPKGTHYIRRYGLYASRARGTWSRKPHLVRLAGRAWRAAHPLAPVGSEPAPEPQEVERKTASSTWARLIAKVYEVDPLQCSECGAAVRIVAVIMDPVEVDKILRHLANTGRAPPGLDTYREN